MEPIQGRLQISTASASDEQMPFSKRHVAVDEAVGRVFPNVLLVQIDDCLFDEVEYLLSAPEKLTRTQQTKFLARYLKSPAHLSFKIAAILYFTLSKQSILDRNKDLYDLLQAKFSTLTEKRIAPKFEVVKYFLLGDLNFAKQPMKGFTFLPTLDQDMCALAHIFQRAEKLEQCPFEEIMEVASLVDLYLNEWCVKYDPSDRYIFDSWSSKRLLAVLGQRIAEQSMLQGKSDSQLMKVFALFTRNDYYIFYVDQYRFCSKNLYDEIFKRLCRGIPGHGKAAVEEGHLKGCFSCNDPREYLLFIHAFTLWKNWAGNRDSHMPALHFSFQIIQMRLLDHHAAGWMRLSQSEAIDLFRDFHDLGAVISTETIGAFENRFQRGATFVIAEELRQKIPRLAAFSLEFRAALELSSLTLTERLSLVMERMRSLFL